MALPADQDAIATETEWTKPWAIPLIEEGLCEDWMDAWLAMQLCDVLARRHYGTPFLGLSVEDRNVIRGEAESFIRRQTWIQRKRDRQVTR